MAQDKKRVTRAQIRVIILRNGECEHVEEFGSSFSATYYATKVAEAHRTDVLEDQDGDYVVDISGSE